MTKVHDELSEREMRQIAEKFVTKNMKIGKKGKRYENVRILYNITDPSCVRFAEIIEEECWKVGAHTLMIPDSSIRDRRCYELKPEDSLSEMSKISEALAKSVDVTIYIGEEDDPNWARGLAHKLRLSAPVREKIREILDKRKVRWAYFGWPVPGAAKGYGFPVKKFREIFFDCIRETFRERLLETCEVYRKSLENRKEVRITADDGTDLCFSIKKRPILVDDGILSEEDLKRGDVGVNIPAGEVFVAPIETSAKGEIFFDEIAIPGFGKVKQLRLTFENGKIEKFEAEMGEEAFKKFLDANTGEKDRIAEFGIGTNRMARYTGGSIIIDEKIFGTIHIAIGNNRGAYHGKNKASCHLDMIKDMRDGEVTVDGLTIMKGGKPIEH
ncbi:MAG: aminopeptidase [Candidatus Hadarchaeales archaeon]